MQQSPFGDATAITERSCHLSHFDAAVAGSQGQIGGIS
jgi:hypothetical protein